LLSQEKVFPAAVVFFFDSGAYGAHRRPKTSGFQPVQGMDEFAFGIFGAAAFEYHSRKNAFCLAFVKTPRQGSQSGIAAVYINYE
jgi:hypothetical protein